MDFISEYSASECTAIAGEFKRLKGNHYLDHAGATLYSEKQLQDVFEDMATNLYANPHTSKDTEDLIDQVRYKILEHFNTNTDAYSVVFTAGATASLKCVAETFEFKENGEYVYLQDNHTSVLGMRELVQTPRIRCIRKSDLLDELAMKSQIIQKVANSNSLLVYPAQCNFSGYKYPLELVKTVQTFGMSNALPANWYVCVDAASYAATGYLDLSEYRADYVCISFYKMFGYPTGLGALIVSKRGERALSKKYYGGGTVKIAMTERNWHRKRDTFHERFEDGTVPFLSIVALLSGFKTLDRLVPARCKALTMIRIAEHCFRLAKYLYTLLKQMQYENGRAVVHLYHDGEFKSARRQGGIVNFNVLNSDGSYVGFSEIVNIASIHNILLRTGCFCNPGACQRHLRLTENDLRTHFKAGHICGDSIDLIDGIPTGSVRVSVGYMTSKEDVDAVVSMIRTTFVNPQNLIVTGSKYSAKVIGRNPNPTIARRTRITLKEICVFPVKSCGAFKVRTQWPLTQRGLKYDREWMIVKSNGVCMTQKNNTKLCLIKPYIDEHKGELLLSFPHQTSISVPLTCNENKRNTLTSLCQSKVCGDRIQGIDCGDNVADWLSSVLGTGDVRLIRQSSSDTRSLSGKSQKDEPNKDLSLANQAQYLLINATSVDWLVQKVDNWCDESDSLPGAIDRFRGNFIVETPIELEEISWSSIQFGRHKFLAVGSCTRCQMICIDQSTGEKTTEPLRTISREFQGKMKFGIYLSNFDSIANADSYSEASIHCGDSVIVNTIN